MTVTVTVTVIIVNKLNLKIILRALFKYGWSRESHGNCHGHDVSRCVTMCHGVSRCVTVCHDVSGHGQYRKIYYIFFLSKFTGKILFTSQSKYTLSTQQVGPPNATLPITGVNPIWNELIFVFTTEEGVPAEGKLSFLSFLKLNIFFN